MAAIELPCGDEGKDRVVILVDEIASYRSHTVVSYSYQTWTLITLKSGKEHDCRVDVPELTKMIRKALDLCLPRPS